MRIMALYAVWKRSCIICRDEEDKTEDRKVETYNVWDYGITTDAEDNSDNLQKLMDMLSAKNGGTIYFPIGTYRFRHSVWARSYVNIQGENKSGVILKMEGSVTETTGPFALFFHHYPDDREALLADPVVGCTYSDFTVDATELQCDRYRTGNKAFYYQNCQDCTWRDLRLIGTPATALGVDCLVNCFITRIYCRDCGRVWEPGVRYGGASIGIGAGLFDEENVIISECIVEGSGHYGIFLEHQALFNKEVYLASPRGVLVTDCIVRNGRNHGIGARGMQNMKISSNMIYDNAGCGVYLDNQADCIDVSDNMIRTNKEAAIRVHAGVHDTYSGTTGNMDHITIRNNDLVGNTQNILLTGEEGKRIRDLFVKGNATDGSGQLPGMDTCLASVERLRCEE